MVTFSAATLLSIDASSRLGIRPQLFLATLCQLKGRLVRGQPVAAESSNRR